MIGMVLVVLFGLAYSFFIDPTKSPDATFPCVTREAFGIYCPGCGDTRALHALTHGKILTAFDYNFLFPFIVIILAWYFLVGLTTLFFKKRVMWIPQSLPTWGIVMLCVTIVAFTVFRNLPWWPFTILAP